MNAFLRFRLARFVFHRRAAAVFRALASLKLAVTLWVVLAGVLAGATFLEGEKGADLARWYVYESRWFAGLLGLLGVNVFCAAAIRFPWSRRQTGFVVTHAGLLVLLTGALLTFRGGLEGSLTIAEGETAASMLIPGRSQITASWTDSSGPRTYAFAFQSGPGDWREGKTLDIGRVDGVGMRILNYYRHAQPVERWVEDGTRTGGPVIKFHLTGPDGKEIAEHWLADEHLGDEVFAGPLLLRLAQAANDAMVEDFLHPPVDGLGEKGVLLVYFGDAAQRVSLDDHVGKWIPLGQTGAAVQVVQYLANARATALGQFGSRDEQPKNPLLELSVRLPGGGPPIRQIAFAKSPLLNLDGVYGRVCPVTFRYYHPAVEHPPGIALLQDGDGRLHCSVCRDGQFVSHGRVNQHDRIAMPGGFELAILQHLPHARRQVTFEPATAISGKKTEPQAAAQVEISMDSFRQRVWLRQNDPSYASRTVTSPRGAVQLCFESARSPLGFSLQLVELRRGVNPGRAGDATLSSTVRIVDEAKDAGGEREISMNRPLTHNKLTFYQSGFRHAGHGREASILSVAYDPGRVLKYLGSLMICSGMGIVFCMRRQEGDG